jgi:hypothetical protein
MLGRNTNPHLELLVVAFTIPDEWSQFDGFGSGSKDEQQLLHILFALLATTRWVTLARAATADLEDVSGWMDGNDLTGEIGQARHWGGNMREVHDREHSLGRS